MSEPSLEQIAEEGFRVHVKPHRVANVLARELIALTYTRDTDSDVNYARYEEITRRLDAFESQARPSQESGELAVGRPRVKTTFVSQEEFDSAMRALGWSDDADMNSSLVARYMAERDAAIARADEAERGHREVCDLNQRLIEAHAEQLRKYGDHTRACVRYSPSHPLQTCTCGLQAALDGSGQHDS